jgi:hypothetical protein
MGPVDPFRRFALAKSFGGVYFQVPETGAHRNTTRQAFLNAGQGRKG